MLNFPKHKMIIQEIHLDFETDVRLFIKREDEIDAEISGNKYWKLFFNINQYLVKNPENPLLITFGGAYSNHIAAVAAFGKRTKIKTLGIIRGEELAQKWQDNPTLKRASENRMNFRFVTRKAYQDKENLTSFLREEFPNALIIPEGGTNENAVQGIQYMLTPETQEFDYLCTAVGTGGTLAGISKFCENNQRVIGCEVVADESLNAEIQRLSGKENFDLIDAHEGGYGKINDENIRFINRFYQQNKIPLDPIYTGKMMMKLFELIQNEFFPKNSKILAFHTGGLQGIAGANQILAKQNRTLINLK